MSPPARPLARSHIPDPAHHRSPSSILYAQLGKKNIYTLTNKGSLLTYYWQLQVAYELLELWRGLLPIHLNLPRRLLAPFRLISMPVVSNLALPQISDELFVLEHYRYINFQHHHTTEILSHHCHISSYRVYAYLRLGKETLGYAYILLEVIK